ncbi:hypothetical protein B0H10DRAFT_2436336 [Mycena sp. CBHHK59/15]|nr:hypothetical protein B0H10DRAFT_2436336 [Mycena sp. CBHHK59/15]
MANAIDEDTYDSQKDELGSLSPSEHVLRMAGSDYEVNPSQHKEEERTRRRREEHRLAAARAPVVAEAQDDSVTESESEEESPEMQRIIAQNTARDALTKEVSSSSPPRKRRSAFGSLIALHTNTPYMDSQTSTQDFVKGMNDAWIPPEEKEDLLSRCLRAEADRDKYRSELLLTLEELVEAEHNLAFWRSSGTAASSAV